LKALPKAAQSLATLREFRVDSVDDYEVGQTVSIEDLFTAGDNVDVSGVSKGVRMAGHMGDDTETIKKVRVVRTDPERNLLLVKGSLPGARGSLILVRKV